MGHHEKRLNSRITIRDDVMLVTPGTTQTEICTLENISIGGIKFFTVHQFVAGDRIELRIPSPDDKPAIIIHAIVLRSESGAHDKPFGYACLIDNVEND